MSRYCCKSLREAARPWKFDNNRIRIAGSVNQNSQFGLRARKLFFIPGPKILLQQYRPGADIDPFSRALPPRHCPAAVHAFGSAHHRNPLATTQRAGVSAESARIEPACPQARAAAYPRIALERALGLRPNCLDVSRAPQTPHSCTYRRLVNRFRTCCFSHRCRLENRRRLRNRARCANCASHPACVAPGRPLRICRAGALVAGGGRRGAYGWPEIEGWRPKP
jgi:hypothetical protein